MEFTRTGNRICKFSNVVYKYSLKWVKSVIFEKQEWKTFIMS